MLEAIRHQIAAWIDPERRVLGISPRVDPTSLSGFFGRSTVAGTRVNERSALGITAFWRGVNLYASTIAALSFEVVERNARGGHTPAREHPVYDLVHARPNRTTPRVHFWQSIIAHALTYKGGFAEIEWSARGRRPLGFHLMDPRSVTPILNDDRTVQYRIDAGGTLLDSSDVLHIRGLPWDGINGYGLVDLACETLGVARAQLLHEGAVFGNGAQMGGILEMPGTLTDVQKNQYRDSWNAVHQGPGQAGKVGILSGGAKWVQNTFSPADTQLIQSRTFVVAEVARLLGIPPHMLGLMDGATVGNAEQQALQFVKFSLLPWLRAIEGELDLKLFSAQERRRYSTRHDTKSLERGDLAARTAYYQGMFAMGAISPNQVMLSEGIDPIEDPNADKHFIPANNLASLEDWDGQPTQPAASQPKKEAAPDGTDPAPAPDPEPPAAP
jgi:HK97 family phage portal protein